MVGKAWDKLMVQQVNHAAKIYVQKGLWVQLLTVLHLVWLELRSVFFKYKSALKYFLTEKFLDCFY